MRSRPSLHHRTSNLITVSNLAGDSLVNHQPDLDAAVLGSSTLRLVLRYRFQLSITERLDQAIGRHLVLRDDVIDNGIGAPLAQVDIAL